MTNVILLADRNSNRPLRIMPEGASAEIVIFHGVRIERLTDDMIAQTTSRSTRRLPSLNNQATAAELE
ncbi:MAG: hypothetical protein M3O03_13905 [Pseudomonadota bacterium]|nr:hypothetical protein [Pseudomonadota bacterium]